MTTLASYNSLASIPRAYPGPVYQIPVSQSTINAINVHQMKSPPNPIAQPQIVPATPYFAKAVTSVELASQQELAKRQELKKIIADAKYDPMDDVLTIVTQRKHYNRARKLIEGAEKNIEKQRTRGSIHKPKTEPVYLPDTLVIAAGVAEKFNILGYMEVMKLCIANEITPEQLRQMIPL